MVSLFVLSNLDQSWHRVLLGSLCACVSYSRGYQQWKITQDGRIVLEGGKDCEDELEG